MTRFLCTEISQRSAPRAKSHQTWSAANVGGRRSPKMVSRKNQREGGRYKRAKSIAIEYMDKPKISGY